MGYTAGPGESGAPDRKSRIRRILVFILALNLAVALAKLGWGYVAGSVSMVADGFHSLFDGASNVIGLVGLALAARPADRDHPYGHGKYETYASAAIGAMLAFAAYNVGSAAIGRLLEGSPPPRVDAIAFGVMLGTLAVNIGVTLYERAVGKRLGSEILVADASHTGSDALVSVGVIAGLVAVRAGYPIADPLIALVVAGVIAYTALNVFRQATVTLSDTARIDPKLIASVCMEVPEVLGCHHVRTRGSAAEVYVDLHIQVDPAATVTAGHAVAESVEREVCHSFESVVDVVAHLEPYDAYQVGKTVKEIDAGLA
ncbi:MAG: cation diffusion facilitator family transporter [Anaerosomatales bacterium]|nr:cation diffusion facilitator family transporter [Anaerosomatales bacterium]MDT8434550.1 cation diffusion facilitator family transporter [Anaerosomatales bacterium]